LVRDVADFIRGTENALLFNHSRRVFWRGALHGHRLGLRPDLELLYSAAMFNDIGLTDLYRDSYIRFEIDGANAARDFLLQHGIDESDARKIWLGVPLHTTPGVPEFLEPEIALITAGVETDNMAIGRDELLRRKYGAREGDRSRVSIHLPEAEDVHGGGLSFKGMESSLDESGRRDVKASTHCWVRRMASPVVLVSCSTRAATLTVSPMRVNSSLPPPPMVPAITTPVLIPIPMRSSPPNRSATRR
jgi:hypothetical protein